MTQAPDLRGRRCVRLRLGGRVQGVGYRAWLTQQAALLALEGWARNRRDGSLEAVVAGDPDAVATLAEASLRGPPRAAVQGIEIVDAPEETLDLRRPGFVFDVLPDA